MADFSTLIATLRATIKTNYNQEITGQILQDDLLAIVDAVNRLKQDTLEGYAFYGASLADGASVSVTQNTFFLVGKGTYTINGSTIEVDTAGVSVIVYDSVNNTTNWYTLFAYDTTPTENSRNAITSGAVAAALAPLATKEDVEAVEQEVAQIAGEAGLAEAVIDTDGAGTEQEFTFRKSGGDGGAYYRKIKGKTLGWNQLVPDNRIEGNGTDNSYVNICSVISSSVHKYYARVKCSGSNVTRAYLVGADAGGEYREIKLTKRGDIYSGIVTLVGFEGAIYFRIGTTTYVSWEGAQLIDLTQMFGAGNEPSSVAEFEALYPDIYPYNPGTLISNDADAVETTGVNQWDEEWESGTIDDNTGENSPAPDKIRVKNFIPAFPATQYFVNTGGKSISNAFCYDAEKHFIGTCDLIQQVSGNWIIETLANTSFIKVAFSATYGTTYNHDICINLSNAAINGQYFPYWKRTLQLGITTRKDTDGNVPFPNGLQSCPIAQDEATQEGGTIRVGTRAYQAGDESDANVITDGTNTNYALATPVPFTWAEPLNLGVKVDENGTERAVAPEGATAPSAPFVADTTYTMSVARMVEKLQNL